MISYTGREKGGLNKVVEKDFESRLVILQSGQRECRPHIKGSIWWMGGPQKGGLEIGAWFRFGSVDNVEPLLALKR